jgi:hypothetical protein
MWMQADGILFSDPNRSFSWIGTCTGTGRMLDFTKRKSTDMTTALKITKGFREIMADDPVKYDFTLTHFDIRNDLTIGNLEKMICYES